MTRLHFRHVHRANYLHLHRLKIILTVKYLNPQIRGDNVC